jgi:hypothetical protein
MAAPFPPQGNQQQFTERPLKVYGEQYLEGEPVPVGVVTVAYPPLFAEGDARIYTPDGRTLPVQKTDWVLTHRYSGQAYDVLSAEEFSERFGGAS